MAVSERASQVDLVDQGQVQRRSLNWAMRYQRQLVVLDGVCGLLAGLYRGRRQRGSLDEVVGVATAGGLMLVLFAGLFSAYIVPVPDVVWKLFDGLFVGLPDGKVTVLAVENESKADKAGLKAGDEILAVGGIPTRNDLDAFSAAFAAIRAKAREDELPSYSLTVRSEGKPDAFERDIIERIFSRHPADAVRSKKPFRHANGIL